MESIRLLNTSVDGNTVKFSFSFSEGLAKFFAADELFISYDEDISDISIEILNIPFVSLMLPVAWITNSIIWVEKLDYTFYESIFNIKRAYQEFYPEFKFGGTVVPAYAVRGSISDSGKKLVLYSGGLDSITTYINNKSDISSLFNIFGWVGSKKVSYEKYQQDKLNMIAFSQREDTPISFSESNFTQVISDRFDELMHSKIHNNLWYGMQHSMMFISIAIPFAVKHSINTILIASSNTIGFRKACASDPTTDIEFNFMENGHTIHDGFELNRQDKIRCVVEYQKHLGKPFPIQVCSFNDNNCCSCEKCFRTILGLVAENAELSDFGFYVDGDLKQHFLNVLKEKEQFLGLTFEEQCYWGDIQKRMTENYSIIEEKEFVDWFFNYDFRRGKKQAVARYRRENFWKLVFKKTKSFLKKFSGD